MNCGSFCIHTVQILHKHRSVRLCWFFYYSTVHYLKHYILNLIQSLHSSFHNKTKHICTLYSSLDAIFMAFPSFLQHWGDPYVLSILEFFSSISALLSFHKCHVKESSTITKSQIQKRPLPVFLTTKLNKLPPSIHSKMANRHMNCHPSAWPRTGGIPLLQEHCWHCKAVLQLQQEQGKESPPNQ